MLKFGLEDVNLSIFIEEPLLHFLHVVVEQLHFFT